MKKLIIIAVAFLIASPAIFAQTKAGKIDNTTHATLYACPVHSSVIINILGKCPLCGMDLNLSQKEQIKTQVVKGYSCPLYADIVTNNEERNLNLSLKEKMKMEVVKLNSYPIQSGGRDLVVK
jgi:putative DNA topoisomerase